jgi:hypothetical protein
MEDAPLDKDELREKVLKHIQEAKMMPNTSDIARAIGGSYFDISQVIEGLVQEKFIMKGPTGRLVICKNKPKNKPDTHWEPTCVRKDSESRIKVKIQKNFKCKHCGRPFAYMLACLKHERSCPKNLSESSMKAEEPLEVTDTECNEVEVREEPVKTQTIPSELLQVQTLLDLCRPPSDFNDISKKIGPFLVTVRRIEGA